MRKFILTTAFALISFISFSQIKFDTTFNVYGDKHKLLYTSYFNKAVKAPVMVTYILQYNNNAQKCVRKDKWVEDNVIKKGLISTNKNYSDANKIIKEQGVADLIDKGHNANYEDFCNDSVNAGLTERFYNAVGQYHSMNAGKYKELETKIRNVHDGKVKLNNVSTSDSLFIICYNHFSGVKIGDLFIPDTCYKLTYKMKGSTYTFIQDLSGAFPNKKMDKNIIVNPTIVALVQSRFKFIFAK